MTNRAGSNASIYDVASLGLAHVRRMVVNRVRARVSPTKSPELVELGPLHAIMRRYWKEKLHVSDATVEYFFRDAFDYSVYEDAIARSRQVWGSFAGKRVLDVGSGWGGLSLLLAREGANVSFVDQTPEHVEVARARVPGAQGFLGDACALGEVEQLRGPFDYVFLHSLIEHVAPPPGHRGPAAPTLEAKRAVLNGAARLLAPNGGLFVSTGNYQFPLDGEIKTWFFHWLTQQEQREVLSARGIDADRYGLFRWPELEQMAREAGLDVDQVQTSLRAVENVRFLLTLLSAVSAGIRASLPRVEIEQLVHRVAGDPNWMPVWFAFFKAKGIVHADGPSA